MSLLGQEKEGNGRQVSRSRSRSPSERRQLKGRETGEIIKRRGAGKERRGGNRRQQSKLVEAQRQFFRSCVTQDRLDLALQYVDALDTSSCSPSSAHARGGEGRQGVKGSKSTRKEFQGTKERDQAKLYQSLLSSCVRLNAFQSACDVHKRHRLGPHPWERDAPTLIDGMYSTGLRIARVCAKHAGATSGRRDRSRARRNGGERRLQPRKSVRL